MESSKKVSQEQAELEIQNWLDKKKISESKRESSKESIKSLIEAVTDGVLVIDDENRIHHELKFPIQKDVDVATRELVYKPRLAVRDIHQHLHGVKSDAGDQRLLAYVVALTGKAKGIIQAMDSEDYAIATSIAFFFI